MMMINLEFKAPARNVVRDVFTVLRNIETAALFLACFILGRFFFKLLNVRGESLSLSSFFFYLIIYLETPFAPRDK